MAQVNRLWKCDYKDADGNIETHYAYASTTIGAEQRALYYGLNNNLTADLTTLKLATRKEESELKKKIKEKLKGRHI